jgi:hypothetical protein
MYIFLRTVFFFFVFAEHALTKKKTKFSTKLFSISLREGGNFYIFMQYTVYMLPGQLKTKSKLSYEWRTVLLL